MMKHEFEARARVEVSALDWVVIERVYTWHPSIPNIGGKDRIAALYTLGGMELMHDMDIRASKNLEEERAICERIRQVSSGMQENSRKIGELKQMITHYEDENMHLRAECAELNKRRNELYASINQ